MESQSPQKGCFMAYKHLPAVVKCCDSTSDSYISGTWQLAHFMTGCSATWSHDRDLWFFFFCWLPANNAHMGEWIQTYVICLTNAIKMVIKSGLVIWMPQLTTAVIYDWNSSHTFSCQLRITCTFQSQYRSVHKRRQNVVSLSLFLVLWLWTPNYMFLLAILAVTYESWN